MNTELGVKIDRIHYINGNSTTKAFCDLLLFDAFVVKGLRVVQGNDGLFVSMPREQGSDGKWYDTFRPILKEIRQDIQELVLDHYRENVEK